MDEHVSFNETKEVYIISNICTVYPVFRALPFFSCGWGRGEGNDDMLIHKEKETLSKKIYSSATPYSYLITLKLVLRYGSAKRFRLLKRKT